MLNWVFAHQETRRMASALALASGWLLSGCGPAGAVEPAWPPAVKEWYSRALASYETSDQDDARVSVERALAADPNRPEVRILAARIALAGLDYPAVLKHTEGLPSAEARGLRARARWYAGELTEAAEELEQLLADPEVHDGWAEGVLHLARQGFGRKPFALKGSRLAVTDLTAAARPAMVIPLELNGQPVLGLISTGSAEVVVDSAGSRDPSWVTLGFEKRFEVSDVPALTEDLSGISRELNKPIKVLLGVNLLRHVNATFDLLGQQFVVRNYEAPAPPLATKLPVQYVRGGGMVVRGQLGSGPSAPDVVLFVDSREGFSLALDDEAWKLTGVRQDSFMPVPGRPAVRQARLGQVRLGAYDVPSVPALQGEASAELEKSLGVRLDGRLGTGLLGTFRVSFTDAGRALYLEDLAASLPPADSAEAESNDGFLKGLPPGGVEAPPASE